MLTILRVLKSEFNEKSSRKNAFYTALWIGMMRIILQFYCLQPRLCVRTCVVTSAICFPSWATISHT
jgi:hypothetical protein